MTLHGLPSNDIVPFHIYKNITEIHFHFTCYKPCVLVFFREVEMLCIKVLLFIYSICKRFIIRKWLSWIWTLRSLKMCNQQAGDPRDLLFHIQVKSQAYELGMLIVWFPVKDKRQKTHVPSQRQASRLRKRERVRGEWEKKLDTQN